MPRILIVEDEKKIARFLELELKHEGYDVLTAFDGRTGLETAQDEDPDLLILDLMLPELSGIEVCRRLRHTSDIPIIMLTAKGAEYDKVMALDIGADDYVTKPFGMMELISRIRAVLRRTTVEKEPDSSLRYGRFELNEMKHSFHLNGKAIDLTNKEFELMKRLLSNPEIVIPRSSLIDEIWGHDFSGESRTLDVHIATLRQKLGEAGDCIETVRGIGYRMRSKQRRRNHEKANPNF